ncbi:hypothetical protein JG688_00003551 [Phytophthora aleatoria]|uniref:Helicase C-terminal domain-containing protein n=1 Tax=Phytophthora aleatoria TaxID=2496075 RepID=A0A8J5JER8_9STRA|nr:hypothetical protein JG688_00003551 [Phytophthora aleatoria]
MAWQLVFLRRLVLFKRAQVLHIDGAYVVEPDGRNFGRLKLRIKRIQEAALDEELAFIKSHIEGRHNTEVNMTDREKIQMASHSTCHVMGCTMHRWNEFRVQGAPDRVMEAETARYLPPVTPTSSSPTMNLSTSDISSNMPVKRENMLPASASPLPMEGLPIVLECGVYFKEEWPELREPTLNRQLNLLDLNLYLTSRMNAAQTDLHSFDVAELKIQLVPGRDCENDRELEKEFGDLAYDACGGLDIYVDNAQNLKQPLPRRVELTTYDVVIVSFARAKMEWTLRRPPTAMEMQRTPGYGFDDQPDRYKDGSTRGEISSLLSVHWLRVVVDEGHKLGSGTTTQLVEMTRLLSTANQRQGTADDVHPDSLLHAKSRKGAHEVENDLAVACMGGYAVEWTLTEKKMKSTIAKLRDDRVGGKRIAEVAKYLDGVCVKKTTKCRLKLFYIAARIHELMKEFEESSQGRQHELKVIVFSQIRECISRAKVAFKQQDILTADLIPPISPSERITNLAAFRSDPDLHVLLLPNLGSHGLDLSFVTHIFLLEEIWDKSVEQQVISRAHRMGATQSLVVEQLFVDGTVECQLKSVNQQLFKRERSIVDSENGQLQPTREEVQEASSVGKNNFQAMKISYLLNTLRVLSDDKNRAVDYRSGPTEYSKKQEISPRNDHNRRFFSR